MKRIGLTGGIGSGKSIVADLFRVFDIPVYDADVRSKELCISNAYLIDALKSLYGPEVYLNHGQLNKPFMASKMFADANLLKQTNQLIHPIVATDFSEWAEAQEAEMVVQESALIFESNLDYLFDAVICVAAPTPLRIKRVCDRNHCSEQEVLERMRRQLPENEKISRSDFVVVNDGKEPLIPQIQNIIASLSEL